VACAIGILPHTGWAWLVLVRVEGSPRAPRVAARARVTACGVEEGQLYHLAAEHRGDPAGFLSARRTWAVGQAARALEPHLAEAGAAVVLGKAAALPALERILAAHPLLHAAEGELWRTVFAEACAARGLAVTRAAPEGVRAALAGHHSGEVVEAFLAQGRRDLGSPWSREPQDAALAAWGAL